MANCGTTKKGILFIYEDDGYEWTEYLKKQLKKPSYSIPCTSIHWRRLTESVTSNFTVHIFLLTPQMEPYVSKINFELLNYSCDTSLILECNVDSSQLQMVEWAVKHKLEDSVENRRNLMASIIRAYETAEDDADYDDELDINIVPTTIFPGQEEIFITFNKKQDWIIVRIDGAKDRPRTRKYTDFIFGCKLPRDTSGPKNIGVYKEDHNQPIYQTSITVVTVNVLLQNLVDNLESTFRFCCNMSDREEISKERLSNTFPMGIRFNPFLEASDEILFKFAQQVHDLYKLSLDDPNEDNNFSLDPKNKEKTDGKQLTDVQLRRLTMERARSFPVDSKEMNQSLVVGSQEMNQSLAVGSQVEASRKKKLFNFGKKKPNPKKEKEKNKGFRGRRTSRRVATAMTENLTNMPRLPPNIIT